MDLTHNGHMTAAVLYGPEDLKVETIDIPPLASNDVLVKVEVALTCGTDLKVWKRGYHARMIRPPSVFGHELAGTIEEKGSGVNGGFHKGMRVVPANSAPCGLCYYCRKGQQNLCEDLLFNNGAYAQYIRVPARIVEKNLLEIPDNVSFRDAAMVEPLACVLRGVHEMNVHAGDTAVVIGCGPIGLKFIRVLSARGIHVIALGKRKSQMIAAERLGAQATIDVAKSDDPIRRVLQLTGARPGRRCRDRSRRSANYLAMGRANGAQRRHGESVRRLPAWLGSEIRSFGAALFRNHHQVHFSPCATIHPRSAGHHLARRSGGQRFRDR